MTNTEKLEKMKEILDGPGSWKINNRAKVEHIAKILYAKHQRHLATKADKLRADLAAVQGKK